jgi:hypothetical protein
LTDYLEAKEGNIVCPGYEVHEPRILDTGEVFALTDEGSVVCSDCANAWTKPFPTPQVVPFYPQED